MKPIHAAELLIDKIKRDYTDDIALVVVMGSHIYGETHSRSDLDMFFVPKTARGRKLEFTFILDGIGYDFWGISWERLARIAAYEERITSIITEGQVLYCASQSDRERWEALKASALDTGDRNKFVHKARAKLDEVYKDYAGLLGAASLSEARRHALEIIYTVTTALALLNRITVKRGRGRLRGEILAMPLVPEDFASLYDTVFVCSDIARIQAAYGQLIKNTEILIAHEEGTLGAEASFAEELTGFYEELINYYNKIYHACEIGDASGALFPCVEIVHEIGEACAGTGVSTAHLPDIVGAYDPEKLEQLAAAAHEHQTQFVELLAANGVKLKEFGSWGKLETFLESL